MKYLLILLIPFIACNQKAKSQPANLVQTLFDTHKTDWNILSLDLKLQNIDYYKDKLRTCNLTIQPSALQSYNTYVLEFPSTKDVIIEKYTMNSLAEANTAFQTFNTEADVVRNLKRAEYGELCYEISGDQFYYVAQKGNDIYLFGTSRNLEFPSGTNVTVQTEPSNLLEVNNAYEFIKNY